LGLLQPGSISHTGRINDDKKACPRTQILPFDTSGTKQAIEAFVLSMAKTSLIANMSDTTTTRQSGRSKEAVLWENPVANQAITMLYCIKQRIKLLYHPIEKSHQISYGKVMVFLLIFRAIFTIAISKNILFKPLFELPPPRLELGHRD
jgi:hypothetical protein